MGWIKKVLGIGSGISWIVYAVLIGIGVAIGTAGTAAVEEIRLDASQAETRAETARADANSRLLDRMNAEAAGLAASLAQAAEINKHQQDEADRVERDAAEIQARQRAASSSLQDQLDVAKAQTRTIMQALKDAHHETLGQPIRDGFDPLILVGIDWLRCLQRAGNAGGDEAACAGRSGLSAGGPAAPIDGTGTGNWRPTFEQQRWLLNELYKLHDWGRGSVGQIEAIAKTQRTGPVTIEGPQQ